MTTFLVSDTHFGHENILKFVSTNGERVRPEWDDVNEMNEAMIARWNERVRVDDVVYHLGDFSMNARYLHLAGRLKGRKHLILGNHDHSPISEYLRFFDSVQSCKRLGNLLLTHYPVHPSSIGFGIKGNAHGHTHEKSVDDPRYVNVSVEVIGYRPISIEDVRGRLDYQMSSADGL
jgi:calcineurin-like phosphoesterase family protein